MKLLLSCEHGGYKIPSVYEKHFSDASSSLRSHRGYDPGALDLFRKLKPLADFSFSSEISRLLVELNRSPHHPSLFSEFSRPFSAEEKERLLETHYWPYRQRVEEEIRTALQESDEVLHLSVHSFTPELNGELRNTDIGLLYDPSRSGEKDISKTMKRLIHTLDPALKVRYNYPYLGKADGLTTYLRNRFPKNYCGIEIEVNQKFAGQNNSMDGRIKEVFFNVLKSLLVSH